MQNQNKNKNRFFLPGAGLLDHLLNTRQIVPYQKERYCVHFADGPNAPGGGDGTPPEDGGNQSGGTVKTPEEKEKAQKQLDEYRTQLDKDRKDGLIDAARYSELLRQRAGELGLVDETAQAEGEKPAADEASAEGGKKDEAAAESGKKAPEKRVKKPKEGEEEALSDVEKERKSKNAAISKLLKEGGLNYREFGVDNMEQIKANLETLNAKDREIQHELKQLITSLGIPADAAKNEKRREAVNQKLKSLGFEIRPPKLSKKLQETGADVQQQAEQTVIDKVDVVNDEGIDVYKIFKELREEYQKAEGKTEQEINQEIKALEEKLKSKKISGEELAHKKYLEETLLPEVRAKKQAIDRMYELKKAESALEKRMGEEIQKLAQVSKKMEQELNQTALKNRMIENASQFIGIKIRAGAEIGFEDLVLDENYNPKKDDKGSFIKKKRKFRIKNIEFGEKPRRKKGFEEGELGWQIENPTIEIEEIGAESAEFGPENLTHYSGGEMAGKYSLADFKKLVDQHDLTEEIKNLKELNENLGWGVDIKEGMQLEYNRIVQDPETGKLLKVPQTIRIEKIADDKITLDKEIEIGVDERVNGGKRFYGKEPSFGEFAKWYRIQQAQEKIPDLQSLQLKLKELNDFYNKKYDRPEEQYPPILVVPGEALHHWGEEKPSAVIKSVSPDGNIQIVGDGELTPTQFYRWVKDNGLEKFDPAAEAKKRAEGFDDEALKKAIEEEEIKEVQRQIEEEKKRAAEKGTELEAAGAPFFSWDNPDALWNKHTLWHDMRFLSFHDFKQMGQTIWDFVVRRYQRRSKYNYGMIGMGFPGRLGAEFIKIKQGAENEEVQQYQDAYQALGVWEIKDLLHGTTNTDEAKACFIILSGKGEIRWDDEKMWATLTRITHGKFKVEHEDDCQPAIDSLWGDGQWHEWYTKNNSSYASNKSGFEYKGKQLENEAKGVSLAQDMKRLLKRWKDGNYVNPIEYEELIDFAIRYGKMTAEQKMFFLIAGVITPSPKGYGTLLHMDRLGELDGLYLNNFPMLDFYTQPDFWDTDLDPVLEANPGLTKGDIVADPKKYGVKSRKLRREDLIYLKDKYFDGDYDNNLPGDAFSKFMWEVMIPNPNTRTRLSKGLRSAENMDHDDAHLYIPPATPEEIESLTSGPTGNKKYFTPEAYANAYPGFTQYILSLTKNAVRDPHPETRNETVQAIGNAIRSFTKYDAILKNRYLKHKGSTHQRLGNHHYDRHSVVDSEHTRYHQEQLRSLVRDIAARYGTPETEIQYLFDINVPPGEENAEEKQKQLEKKLSTFFDEGGLMDGWFKSDNGEKMLKVICEHSQEADYDTSGKVNSRSMRGMGLFMEKDSRTIGYQPPRAGGGEKTQDNVVKVNFGAKNKKNKGSQDQNQNFRMAA